MPAHTVNYDLRYGISALDMSNVSNAINDELLVQGVNGKIFYKREEDGQVVSYDSIEYNKESLIYAITTALAIEKVAVTLSGNDFVTYNTIDISGKTNILEDSSYALSLNRNFHTLSEKSGFLLRVRGNSVTNAALSFLELYAHEQSINDSKFLVTIDITEESEDGSVLNQYTDVIELTYNTLKYVALSKKNADCVRFGVKLVSIIHPTSKESFNSLPEDRKTEILNLTNNNPKLESDFVDIISFCDKTSDVIIYDANDCIQLVSLVSIQEIIDVMNSRGGGSSGPVNGQGVIVSMSDPGVSCIWGEIKNIQSTSES